MKSILNKNVNEEIKARIMKLSPSSKALWGKMNAAQMMAHCVVGLKIAFGEITPKSNFLFKLMGKFFKKKIFAAESFKKNSPTAKEFIIPDNRDFFVERAELLACIKKCAEFGGEVFTKEPHVFFGFLSADEWDELTFKHLDHHLNQFGV